jgi:glutamyl-tRNA synthetase
MAMPEQPVRVRFAPSPTGVLHIGGARTALYNWLLARKHPEGQFILRIEDTDPERSTEEAVEQILDALRWLEIDWDDGPIYQTTRERSYSERLQQLLDSGHAYWDTATAGDVRTYKQEHDGRGYRGTEASPDHPAAAVRLRVPDQGETVVKDVIRGEARFENLLLDDFVVARADRSPLYNFAVAIDDADMQITHVVRGEDHLSNTPRQLLVMRALGHEAPTYAHLPLLHGADGKPLSKRHGAASVQDLRHAGYLKEAVRNYLALLGWGYDATTTFFTTSELISRFSLESVSKSPAVFDEQKLSWMNGQYIRELTDAQLATRLAVFLEQRGLPGATDPRLERAAAATKEKLSTLGEFPKLLGFAFEPEIEIDPAAWKKVMNRGAAAEALRAAREALAQTEFDETSIEAALEPVVERLGVKPGKVYQPIRVAITGSTVSAGIFESLALLGKDEALARIDAALARLG